MRSSGARSDSPTTLLFSSLKALQELSRSAHVRGIGFLHPTGIPHGLPLYASVGIRQALCGKAIRKPEVVALGMRREAMLWLRAAEEDLEDAKAFLSSGRWFRAAFFSQQAVEKALRSLFFVVSREEPPHIHTVTELYALLKEAGFSLPGELEEQLFILNKHYTVTRYPDAAGGLPSESVDRVEALRAYNLASEVVRFVREFLGKSS